MAKLTTTSYLILGMLSSRDRSAYELAEQVDKGLTEIWPRARRQIYNAPRQLAEQGPVTATKVAVGRRPRAVYSITPAGRAALREWLATDPKRVSLEFEGMIHLLLADQGTIEDYAPRSNRCATRRSSRGLSSSVTWSTSARPTATPSRRNATSSPSPAPS